MNSPDKAGLGATTLLPGNNEPQRLALLKQAKPFWLAMGGLLGSSLLALLALPPAPATTKAASLAPQPLVYFTLALSCVCAGALVGFLFGIPNTGQPKRDLSGASTTPSGVASADQPSTNLEQVSDWLTKIIIGLSLVEASRLLHALARLGASVQAAAGGSAVVPQFIVVTFGILGFACGYVWTRLYYGSLQMTLDFTLRQYLNTVETRVEQVEHQSTQTDARVATLGQAQAQQGSALHVQKTVLNEVLATKNTSTALAPLPRAADAQFSRLAAPLLGAEAEASPARATWQAKLQEFMTAPIDEHTDPTAAIFGKLPAAVPGRQLEASLVATLAEGVYFIKAQVVGTAAQPLQGTVIFLLHPTYSERAVEVRVDARAPGGSAAYSFSASEPFTLLAMTDDADTLLAYNMATLPGVPANWQRLRGNPD